jgi:hypothetical protein
MEWAEDLPAGCPPEDAFAPSGGVFYRAVFTFPPTERDFYSQRKLRPDRQCGNECEARALSMFSTLDGCRRLKKLYFFKNHLIVSFTLGTQSGLIRESPSQIGEAHCDWWLAAQFNPISLCTEAGRVS